MSQTDPNDTPELMTLPSAARRAGVGLRQLRRARDRGDLPVFLVGGWPRVRWRDVITWITRQQLVVEGPARMQEAGHQT